MMNKEFKDEACVLCGHPARSATYDRGKGKAYIDCKNKDCGEYLITTSAIEVLKSDNAMQQVLSRKVTSRDDIRNRKEILEIKYHGEIVAEYRPLAEALSEDRISFLGFE